MDRNNNIWRDRFDQPRLNHEDWLTPSPDLLSAINHAIDVEHEERKNGFIWWILSSIALILLVLSSSLFFHLHSSHAMENVRQSEIAISTELQPNEDVQITSTGFIPTRQNDDQNIAKNIRPIEQSYTASTLFQIEKEKDEYITQEQTATYNNQTSKGKKNKLSESRNILNRKLEEVNQEGQDDLMTLASRPMISASLIDKLSPNLISLRSAHSPLVQNIALLKPIASTNLAKHSIGMSLGLLSTAYSLSDHYSRDLDPADFSSGRGNLISLGIQYEFAVSSKLSITSAVDYNNIKSISGHNSSINYHVQNEENGVLETHTDLTMATPLGLIETDLLLQRSTANTGDIISSSANVHSEQTLHGIGISIGLLYDLLSFRNNTFFVSSDIRSNVILHHSNQLLDLHSNSDNYSIASGQVIKNQTNLNKQYLQSSIALGWNRRISNSTDLRMKYEYRQGLSKVYDQGDYSSLLSAQGFNIALVSKF